MRKFGDSVVDKEDDVTNELDIDDGTLMESEDINLEEEPSEAEDSEESDDSEDMDEADDSEEEDESAEAEEEKPVAEKSETKEETPKQPNEPDWKADYDSLVDEFGETAAAPFKKMFERMELHARALQEVAREKLTEREAADRRQAFDVLEKHGVDPDTFSAIYKDAVEYMNFQKSRGQQITGQQALEKAALMNGQTMKKQDNERVKKAERMQRLRSIPPKGKTSTTIFNFDDPAEADGTAPRRK